MNKGFTLIELMIVVAIIAIIAAIAIPNLLESKKAANEAAAISALRTVSSAQELYNTRYARYGSLTQLDAANMIDSVLAGATQASSAKSGYYFNMRTGTGVWCCGARAATWGTTGERSFRISQEGVIYFSNSDEDLTSNTNGTALGS